MRRVILESPFAGNWYQRLLNRSYARLCLKDCLMRGEAPFASHMLYPQVLRDDVPAQREWGIASGFAWLEIADASVVYIDRGISDGMNAGIDAARREGVPVEYRSLYKHDSEVEQDAPIYSVSSGGGWSKTLRSALMLAKQIGARCFVFALRDRSKIRASCSSPLERTGANPEQAAPRRWSKLEQVALMLALVSRSKTGAKPLWLALMSAKQNGDFAPRSRSSIRSRLDITLVFQHGEALPAGLMYLRVSGHVLPSGDRDIDIGWIDFEREAPTP